LAIKNAEFKNNEAKITIEKLGNFPVPIYLEVNLSNGTKVDVYHSAIVWKDGKNSFEIKVKTEADVTSITLGNKRVPDINLMNNEFVIKK